MRMKSTRKRINREAKTATDGESGEKESERNSRGGAVSKAHTHATVAHRTKEHSGLL